MRFRGFFILFALALFLAGVPFRQASADDGGSGCGGWVCGKTYTPDEDYAAQSSLRAAIGARAFEMFPNFYRLSYALWGGVGAVLGQPGVQTGLEALEQASYGTPGGADEALFRGLRNLPRVVGGLDEGAGVIAGIGAAAGGRRGGRTGAFAGDVADAVADTLPNMGVVPSNVRAHIPRPPKVVTGRFSGAKFVEFDVTNAYMLKSRIKGEGTATVETGVFLTPDGKVVVVDGRHRATMEAISVIEAGTTQGIPVAKGGTFEPGVLRYDLLELPPSDLARWKDPAYQAQMLVPMREWIEDPGVRRNAAFRRPDPNYIDVLMGVPVKLGP